MAVGAGKIAGGGKDGLEGHIWETAYVELPAGEGYACAAYLKSGSIAIWRSQELV
jgi:hypothetical protein